MEIPEGLSGHGHLRTKRMWLHFHPTVLFDTLLQLSCHPHPPPTHLWWSLRRGRGTSRRGSEYGLVATREDGVSRVLKLDKDGLSLTSIWQFENSVCTFSTTFRPAQRTMLNLSTLAACMALAGRALFPFDTKSHGIINHVEHSNSISAHTSPTNVCPKHGCFEDSFWEIAAKSLMLRYRHVNISSFAGFDNVVRLPSICFQLCQMFRDRLLRLSFFSSFSTILRKWNPVKSWSRDVFGFRQVIVAVPVFGNVFGIDFSNGKILVLGLGWAAEIGGRIHPFKLYVARTVSDGGDPEVVLVTQRRCKANLLKFSLAYLPTSNVVSQRRSYTGRICKSFVCPLLPIANKCLGPATDSPQGWAWRQNPDWRMTKFAPVSFTCLITSELLFLVCPEFLSLCFALEAQKPRFIVLPVDL